MNETLQLCRDRAGTNNFCSEILNTRKNHYGNSFHGEVLRYDTTSNFESAESWSTFDASANGVGDDPVGYSGGIFDGRYIYFAPFKDSNGQYHGEVLRYDTTFQE